jgi:glucosyl-3-phosphoglycerate synthase
MADFHQTGTVSTLHRLDPGNVDTLEQELEAAAARRPVGLVLPCLFSEFSQPAIHHIISELRHVRYLDTIVVSLGRATERDLEYAKTAFSGLPQRVSFVWNDGPSIQSLYRMLGDHGLRPEQDGKGRSCWIAYGYLLADARCQIIAAHDCDIKTYSRELLARLCYPVVHPALDFEFAKGYYARVAGGLNGRVTRVLVTPLLRALQSMIGPHPLLTFLDSFRYPLAGEFAMRADLARVNRLPCSWGLEIGVLAEIHRNCHPRRICQTELCATYDHKHQDVSANDPDRGLLRMSIDIVQALLRALAGEGVVFGPGFFKTLGLRYQRLAEDVIASYGADAAINSLAFDRHAEEMMSAAFGRGLALACERFEDDAASPMLPSWGEVAAAMPRFMELLREVVEEESLAAAAA